MNAIFSGLSIYLLYLLTSCSVYLYFFLSAERDIFGEALSDSDEEAGNINIMDMDEDMSNDDSRFSDTNSLMVKLFKLSLTLVIGEVFLLFSRF